MQIKFPPLRKTQRVHEGIIIKELLRAEEFEGSIKKNTSNGNQYDIIRHAGHDVIVFFENVSPSLNG